MMKTPTYGEIWAVDAEFHCPEGRRPQPICMVGKELLSGRVMRLDEEALRLAKRCPFDIGANSLFLAYFATAELGCFWNMGWPLPCNVIDLYVEFRNYANGLAPAHGWGLLGALASFGLPFGDAAEKHEMRNLAIRGGPFTQEESDALIDYCQRDVEALARLWTAMEPRLNAQALLRGEYMKAVAWMEHVGIPVDTEMLEKLLAKWNPLKLHLINAIDPNNEIWEDGRFGQERFRNWIKRNGIAWPHDQNGKMMLDQDTFSDMAKVHQAVAPIEQLRKTLSKLRLSGLTIGPDGRNRTLFSPFSSRSGRNQPSTSKFIFGAPKWMRRLIKPFPGKALAYLDWKQQEFGIGAVLSGDAVMEDAYSSSDPYLAFAVTAKAVPPDATKHTHAQERSTYKMVVLAVGYCMSAIGLSQKLGITEAHAQELLDTHRKCYSDFWKWSQGVADAGFLHGSIQARFGWRLNVTAETKERSVRNFASQANGAEMMRLAAIYAMRAGIRVCAPVHDAFLIESDLDTIERDVELMRRCMAKASADVLDGFELDTDAEIVRYPDRFGGDSPDLMWDLAMNFINETPPDEGGGPLPAV